MERTTDSQQQMSLQPKPRSNRWTRPVLVLTSATLLFAAFLTGIQAIPAWAAGQSSADWTAEGSVPAEQFGYVVTNLGDYTGDGHVDVAVGAPGFTLRDFVAPGAVLIFPGSPEGLSTTPAYTLTGPDTMGAVQFGSALDAVRMPGLANQGHFVVGAPGIDEAWWYAPGVAIDAQLGMTPTLYFTATGETLGSNFGGTIAVLGDVDADGYADFAVGAPNDNLLTGKVYLYQGGDLTANLAGTWAGEAPGDNFGFSLAGGILRSAGGPSLVVGAPQNDEGENNAGKVYLYHSQDGVLPSVPDQEIVGSWEFGELGVSVAVVGDVNGDGIDDLLIGAVRDQGTGQAYLHLGGVAGVMPVPFDTLSGESPGDLFGNVVAPAGDLNNDGFADVIVAARDWQTNTGRVYVYAGCIDGFLPDPIMIFDGEESLLSSRYGRWVSPLGKEENDLYGGVLVGAPNFSTPTAFAGGKAYGYYIPPTGLPVCAASVELSTTFGILHDGAFVCGTEQTLEVDAGDEIAYCHTVRNTGSVTLTGHAVTSTTGTGDSAGTELLPPGETLVQIVTATATLTDSGVISFSWRSATPIQTPDETGDGLVDSARELDDIQESALQLTVREPDGDDPGGDDPGGDDPGGDDPGGDDPGGDDPGGDDPGGDDPGGDDPGGDDPGGETPPDGRLFIPGVSNNFVEN